MAITATALMAERPSGRSQPQLSSRWKRVGVRGDQQYSGTAPLSEPESRATGFLIGNFRPTVSVWFHQPIGVVDESGGSALVESRFAKILCLPMRRPQRNNGSATSWANTTYPDDLVRC
jgi:hypothetical protein